MISCSKMPYDHTSDLMVNLPYSAASGAVHLMGNLAPANRGNQVEQIEENALTNMMRNRETITHKRFRQFVFFR